MENKKNLWKEVENKQEIEKKEKEANNGQVKIQKQQIMKKNVFPKAYAWKNNFILLNSF